ncbi:MAG: hypothetical protein CL897_04130 [Dehalococcoidia bacterium]|nr:hypothetical protein [Dehalococcoidia bacterium]HCV00531.1 hypothetical protein [Dehalococcoidia bacterium]|tara:strand:- start:1825 stop:3378 length:1554 start_codon:yes stop_codon:yes gene_type:complete
MAPVDEFKPPSDLEETPLRLIPHALRPLPFLAQAMFENFMLAFGGRAVHIKGYTYLGGGSGTPNATLDPSPYSEAREAWEKHALPHVQEICEGLWSGNYSSWPLEELVQAIPGYFSEAARAFAYTMQPLHVVVGPASALMVFCREKLKDLEDPDHLVASLLQGVDNESAARGQKLEELAPLLQASPTLLAAARQGNLTAARAAEGGQVFGQAFDAYLEHYGYGSQTWWELQTPTWREAPEAALRLLAGYVSNPSRGPIAAHARSSTERTEIIAKCESSLAGNEDRTQFRALVEGAADYVFVIEGRAHWQQNCVGALRPMCLALGKKLVDCGALASPEDVFHLRIEELGQLAIEPSIKMLNEIEERKADLETWGKLAPPMTLGPPPPPPPDGPPNPMALMFGEGAEQTGNPLLLKGKGASRGVVTGRARVVFSLEEAEGLQLGEVLVCPFTAPSWMPVFTTASAIVTNQGGVLSHAAIEAREYGIPCVTGTESGTEQIPNGATITVDGLTGTVRIHED